MYTADTPAHRTAQRHAAQVLLDLDQFFIKRRQEKNEEKY